MAEPPRETVNKDTSKLKSEQDKEKPYVCDICDARFSVQLSVQRHRKIHTAEFKCSVCGRHFSSRYDLEVRHMHIHTKELPYKCLVCCSTFRTRKLYKEHTCANITSPVLFCDVCGDRFLLEDDLAKHKSSHGKKRKSSDVSTSETENKHSKLTVNAEPVPILPSVEMQTILPHGNEENLNNANIQGEVNSEFMTASNAPNLMNYEQQLMMPISNGIITTVPQQIPVERSNMIQTDSTLTNLVSVLQNMQSDQSDMFYSPNTVPIVQGGFMNVLNVTDANTVNMFNSEQLTMMAPLNNIQDNYSTNLNTNSFIQIQPNCSDMNLNDIQNFQTTNVINANTFIPSQNVSAGYAIQTTLPPIVQTSNIPTVASTLQTILNLPPMESMTTIPTVTSPFQTMQQCVQAMPAVQQINNVSTESNTLQTVSSMQTVQSIPPSTYVQPIQSASTLLQQYIQAVPSLQQNSHLPSVTDTLQQTCLSPVTPLQSTNNLPIVTNGPQSTSYVTPIPSVGTLQMMQVEPPLQQISNLPGTQQSASYVQPIQPDYNISNPSQTVSNVQPVPLPSKTDKTKQFSMDSSVKRTFHCPKCPKKYYKQSLVDKHMVLHTNPFVCQICGKKFMTKAALELKHMLVHKAENDLKNNVSNDLDDILHAVSNEDYVIEPKEEDAASVRYDSTEDESSRLSADSSAAVSSTLSVSSSKYKDRPFPCSQCGKRYILKIHLNNHMAIHTNPFICRICGKKFSSKELLEKRHMLVHKADHDLKNNATNGIDDILLAVSNSNFVVEKKEDENLLNNPMLDSSTISSLSVLDNDSMNMPQPIKQEVTDSHKTERPFSCTLCKKSYTLQKHLDKHMVIHNNPFICKHCQKKFTTQLALVTHINRFHEDVSQSAVQPEKESNENKVIHDLLLAAATQQNNLDAVAKSSTDSSPSVNTPSTENASLKFTHHGIPPSKFKCPLCPRKYLHKFNLDSHMKVHTDPVICNVCGKKFATKFVLEKMHMPKCSGAVDVKPSGLTLTTQHNKIETINTSGNIMSTSNQSILDNQHQNMIASPNQLQNVKASPNQHQNVMGSSNQNIVVSTTQPGPGMAIYNEGTSSEPIQGAPVVVQDLIAQAILKDKPYECNVCKKRYSVKVNLTKHMVIHLNPFVCKICGKKFLSKAALEIKHMPIHGTNSSKAAETPRDITGMDQSNMGTPQELLNRNQEFQTAGTIVKQEPGITENSSIKKMKPLKAAQKLQRTCQCPYCPKAYFSSKKLILHLQWHSKKYACEICGKTFTSQKALEERHMKSHFKRLNSSSTDTNISMESSSVANDSNNQDVKINTDNTEMLSCTICNKKYAEKRFLQKHMVLHTNPFVCKICGRKFSSKHALERKHMLTHLKKQPFNFDIEGTLYDCCFCRKVYTFRKNLTTHLEGHTNPSTCKICKQVCGDFQEMEFHALMHIKNTIEEKHSPPIPPVPPFQKKIDPPTLQFFAALVVMSNPIGDDVQQALAEKLAVLTLEKLEQEELEAIGESEENCNEKTTNMKSGTTFLKCPFCEKRYSQKQYLDRHIGVHTNPFVCKVCGKAFSSRYALEAKHMLIHSSETPYCCTVCHQGFKELRRLREHVNKKHASVTPHVCKQCGFRFVEANELKEHSLTHVKQAYQCGDCRRNYFSQAALTEHMKCHTGQRTVACEECGNFFVCQSTFDKHLLYTDKENKQYVCQPCSHSFMHKAQFYVLGLVFERKTLMDKKDNINKKSCDENNLMLNKRGLGSNLENSFNQLPLTDVEIVNVHKNISGSDEHHDANIGFSNYIIETVADLSSLNNSAICESNDSSIMNMTNINDSYLVQNSLCNNVMNSDSVMVSANVSEIGTKSDGVVLSEKDVSLVQHSETENLALAQSNDMINIALATKAGQNVAIPNITNYNLSDFKTFTDSIIGQLVCGDANQDTKTTLNTNCDSIEALNTISETWNDISDNSAVLNRNNSEALNTFNGDNSESVCKSSGDNSKALDTISDCGGSLNINNDTSQPLKTVSDNSEGLDTVTGSSSISLNMVNGDNSEVLNVDISNSEALNTTADNREALNTTDCDKNQVLNKTTGCSKALNTISDTSDKLKTTSEDSKAGNTISGTSDRLNTTNEGSKVLNTISDISDKLNTISEDSKALKTPNGTNEKVNTTSEDSKTPKTPNGTNEKVNTTSEDSKAPKTPSATNDKVNTTSEDSKALKTPSDTNDKLNTTSVDSKALKTPSDTSDKLNTTSVDSKALKTPSDTSDRLNTTSEDSKALKTPSDTSNKLNTTSVDSNALKTPSDTSDKLNTTSVDSKALNTISGTSDRLNTTSVDSKAGNTISDTSDKLNPTSEDRKALNIGTEHIT
ncbi:uncharacterized protein LOC126815415 [Patella vulgata]|uniref:uncharacterized protein LOC126815415 n=1 Tax=Patella vulgata TaxID=6465 RepID=UPI00217FB89C|nr:uncharacterized protein LOC126815415 [Patella vulgata]